VRIRKFILNFGLAFAYKIKMRPFIIIGLIIALVVSGLEGRAQYREEMGTPSALSKAIHIYPNPTNDSEYVNIKVSPLRANTVKLTLHNIIGNELTVDTEVVDDHELRIRVKDLASGYYLLAVRDLHSNFRGTYKILKR